MKNSLETVLSQDSLFRNTQNRLIIVIFDTREGRHNKGGKKMARCRQVNGKISFNNSTTRIKTPANVKPGLKMSRWTPYSL